MKQESISRRELASLLLLPLLPAEERQADIRTREDWRRLRERTLAGMQQVMGPLPASPSTAPQIEVLEEERLAKCTRKRINYDSGDGESVPAYLFIPHSQTSPNRAALCLHQTTRIGKAEPAGLGGKPNLHYALELAERSFVTLAPDYPNFGDYKYDPYSHGYVSATMKGIRNHRRALDLLTAMHEVDRRRIGVIGHSLGGHNALFLAAFDPRAAAVVTSCGFTSFPKYYGGNLTGWSHAGYMPRIASEYQKSPAKMPFDFPAILQSLAPRPLFINAPVHDANFDMSGVDDCVAAARQVYSNIFHASGKLRVVHPDCEHDFPPEVRSMAYEFLTTQM